jgi:hypothetical protein
MSLGRDVKDVQLDKSNSVKDVNTKIPSGSISRFAQDDNLRFSILTRLLMPSGRDVTDVHPDKSSLIKDVNVEIPSGSVSKFSHSFKLRIDKLFPII